MREPGEREREDGGIANGKEHMPWLIRVFYRFLLQLNKIYLILFILIFYYSFFVFIFILL